SYHAPPTPDTYTLSLHDALPISSRPVASRCGLVVAAIARIDDHGARIVLVQHIVHPGESVDIPMIELPQIAGVNGGGKVSGGGRSEEHTSELQSRENLVCRLLLE